MKNDFNDIKIIGTDYTASEVMKQIRDWTELTQKEFGNTINRSRTSVQAFELGRRNITLQNFIDLCKAHNLKITIENIKK